MPGSTIDVETPDGTADAYLSLPEGGERPAHGVLFLMDAFGLRPRIEEMADRIAARGYAVLAPNLFYRAGRAPLFEMPDLTDPDNRAAFFGKVRPLMDALTPERIVADGRAYLDELAQHAGEPAAVTGYCMGARQAWRIAAAYPDRVAAFGGFHAGGLVTEDENSPHRSAGQIRARVLLGHADDDPSMTAEQISTLDAALEEAGVEHQTAVYAGAAHGYTMSDTAAYHEEAAERHFSELFELLERAF
jgi:carboxymethylenebutenolidase